MKLTWTTTPTNRFNNIKYNPEQVNYAIYIIWEKYNENLWISKLEFQKLVELLYESESWNSLELVIKKTASYFSRNHKKEDIQNIIFELTSTPNDIRDFWKKIIYWLDNINDKLWLYKNKEEKSFYDINSHLDENKKAIFDIIEWSLEWKAVIITKWGWDWYNIFISDNAWMHKWSKVNWVVLKSKWINWEEAIDNMNWLLEENNINYKITNDLKLWRKK